MHPKIYRNCLQGHSGESDEDRVQVLTGDLSEIPCRVGILPIQRAIFGLNLAYNGGALCKIARKGEYRGKFYRLYCR